MKISTPNFGKHYSFSSPSTKSSIKKGRKNFFFPIEINRNPSEKKQQQLSPFPKVRNFGQTLPNFGTKNLFLGKVLDIAG